MRKRTSLILHGVLFGLGGFILTLPLYYLIGAFLFSDRSNWGTGMGEGFVAFLAALYAVPVMTILWAGAGVWIGAARRSAEASPLLPRIIFTGALALWFGLGFAVQLIMN